MVESSFLPEFRWVRATRYRFREDMDGTPTHIEPHPEAELEVYDPISKWVKHWSGKKRKDSFPPYLAVINGGIEVSEGDGGSGGLTEYGLLGILPQHLRRLVLWPRWERNDEGRWEVRQRGLLSGASGGNRIDVLLARGGRDEPHGEPPESVGHPITPEQFEDLQERSNRGELREPGLERYDPERLRVVPFPLARGYAAYFPGSVPADSRESPAGEQDRRDYPLIPDFARTDPDVEAPFWQHYAEPVPELRNTIRRMESALWILHTSPEHSSGRAEDQRRLQHLLNTLRWKVSASGEVKSVHMPSLLGALYWMMVRDRQIEGRRVDECPMCGRYFATDRTDQKSCSRKCTSRLTTKRYRERKQKGSS